jgi:lipocalin
MGTWYEIERFYVDFEANGKCTKVEYTMTPDGRMGVITTALDTRSARTTLSVHISYKQRQTKQ